MRCALDVGSSAMGLPDLIDPDYPPPWVPAHANDCGVTAIEEAAEAAGEEPNFGGAWPL
ncbi:MAG: hypothetical protein ACTHMS_03190 [Jatrophihabitans sp.]|uniref:hypothetical protein n=1 Tax=Jatrophihabitans sp. TaxID=1932789 RepID=UPI003F8233D2